ncbi:uncharacterized protein LOC110640879 isoform X2 [Hevea brasiliensis]|uniref:uncharacterized protein LOC110640879 isoform X2 n=1 Tax=Hevea brasiliensis TaxID=3981 RepID=UPI0025D01B03|nr:uncharacterized protein LOC110640879 isoform X2 [Hevea brasiliensis]
MGKIGCSVDGNLNESKFSEPLPWIGIYIAVASLACAIVMAADLIHGFRYRKLWFPSKYYSLNATSLTLITVAIKFAVDLNTPMPRRIDQLAKLSSSTLICTLMVPTTKKYLEFKYKKKYEMAVEECSNGCDRAVEKKLREDLMKYWMMAHTCSPQFVIGRSVTCTAAGALCLLSALTLAEAMLRSYLMRGSFKFCNGESDYKWSTILVLILQTIAIGVGTIAPAIRWFTAVNFRCPTIGKKSGRKEFKVEKYWTQFLVEMKEYPFTIRIQNRQCRKLAHGAKDQIVDLCIGMQIGIVLASKVIRFISVYFMSRILLFCRCCKKLMNCNPNRSIDSASDSQPSSKPDLSRFVLHLEGENELVELMMKNNCDATEHWIQHGKKKQPKHLIELLEKSSSALHGVREFDSDLVLSLANEEPPHCWALPVVTLTAIAVAVPNTSSCLRKQLMRSVHEGLMYVKLIEDNLHAESDMANIMKAAYTVWLGVDLYHKWLDVDLNKMSFQAESTKEALEGLADAAKYRYVEFKKTYVNQCLLKESPSKWPIKVLAANSMYRISQTILQNYERSNIQSSERLFEALTIMISDILAACLTNLQRIISLKCFSSSVEVREESVRHAVFLLGKTEKILKLVNQKALPSFDPDGMACINEWRAFQKTKNQLPFSPSSTENETASSDLRDLHLNIE